MWWGRALLVLCLLVVGGRGEVQAQTRADSAAVLLEAADQLRARGEVGAARAVLQLIAERYAGTPAADEVRTRLAELRRIPDQERSGRTELQVFGALHGAWLGIAVPLAAESESPEAYGLGLLAGAPVGFFAARMYASAKSPTEGQARAITFGGTWGTYTGFALAELLDLSDDDCELPQDPPAVCDNSDFSSMVWSGVAGGLVGIGTGALIARKPITAGTAATVTLGGMWGTWFGFAISLLADQEGDDLLLGTMIGGNASLLVLGFTAPDWNISESRARLISLGGLVGGLGGVGMLLLVQPDTDKVRVSFPLIGSIAGLGTAAFLTSDRDRGDSDRRGALINGDRGRWAVGAPEAQLMFRPGPDGSMRPAAYLPILSARF